MVLEKLRGLRACPHWLPAAQRPSQLSAVPSGRRGGRCGARTRLCTVSCPASPAQGGLCGSGEASGHPVGQVGTGCPLGH